MRGAFILAGALLSVALLAAQPAEAADFCLVGGIAVLDHELTSGWVLCCDGDPDSPATWSACAYGGFSVFPPAGP